MDRTEPLEPMDRIEPADPTESSDPTDPTERNDPTENSEPAETMEPTERYEPTDDGARHDDTDRSAARRDQVRNARGAVTNLVGPFPVRGRAMVGRYSMNRAGALRANGTTPTVAMDGR
jgi:hypothetical protein